MTALKCSIATAALILLLAGCQQQNSTGTQWKPDAAAMEGHVRYLADDARGGRLPGTPGYDDAARYTADAFATLGLQPAAENGSFLQHITFRSATRIAAQQTLVITSVDGSLDLTADVDYSIGAGVRAENTQVAAPLVFAGYGLVMPELGHDDYAGLDVTGKVVVVLSASPPGVQSEERAFYASRRAVEASRHGAVGLISLATPESESRIPFARFVASGQLDMPRMAWLTADGEAFTRAPNLRAGAFFSPSGARKLMAAAGRDYDAIIEAARDTYVVEGFDMGLRLQTTQPSRFESITSANVAALLPGTDPELAQQVIVMTAHLDHLGVSQVGGETHTNNGAMDNASGVATLIEAARMLAAQPQRRRSVLFLAVTAEEQGLLGSEYFARNPLMPAKQLVACVNLDMPVLTYDFRDVIVFGGNRSSLREAIASAGEALDVATSPDPFPEQGIFTRSDHFRFVEQGVPSVMLATGFGGEGEAAYKAFLANHYHAPSDNLSLPFDWQAAARFAELNARIALQLANADQRPLWNRGDFFARQFGGPQFER